MIDLKSSSKINRAEKNKMNKKGKSKKKKFWIILGVVAILVLVGFFVVNSIFKKVSPDANLFNSLVKTLPGVENKLDGEDEGRINIALLGMRGKGVVGGGTLADTIIIASIRIIENETDKNAEPTYKVSMVSVPRDLYVTVPDTNDHQKINAVYHYGEERGEGQGLELMKTILRDISGQEIHYAMAVNFAGFEQIVDTLEGVEVTLEEEFIEPMQFHEEKVCDGANGGVFTVKSGRFDTKIDHRGKVVAQYPLCYNSTEECGGVFKVPAGTSVLSGEQALCYVRARVTSSDFDRARRQQEVLKQLKKKALSIGIFSDFGKVTGIMGAVGDNLTLDMEVWEIERFFDLYKKIGDPEMTQRVLENSEEGLLYSHEGDARGYILLPRGENFDKIREMFANII
ncbi:MAG: LCP family protein [Candidatus Moranbacteria bacterium]|nr:LCP family protein [Candidatus Moranbacteria bacterium]